MSIAPPGIPPSIPKPAAGDETIARPIGRLAWGRAFDPTRLAALELRMWKAYYRRQGLRLLALLVQADREQAGVGWPRAVLAAGWLSWAAVRFGRSTGDYDRFLPAIERGYRALGLPDDVDVREVARRELRWWVVRREIGVTAGEAAGDAISRLYAAIYGLPVDSVAEAGRLRGLAAEVRDRGAAADPDGPTADGRAYWPEVARLLLASYQELRSSLDGRPIADDGEPAGSREGEQTRANDYAFLTHWRIPAPPDEIAAILADAEGLARWWPSVYLRVDVLEPGDERGVGKVVDLWTTGWLPYTLRWHFRVTQSDPPRGFAIEATGDFEGRGVWTLTPELAPASGRAAAPATLVAYDWRIRAQKPLLRKLSFILKPLFGANHRWAMARGEESLRLEVARRHAAGDPAIAAAIPEPPGPSFRWLLALRGRGRA